jgi:indole-3-pyruvate monooxygenase
VDSIHQTETLIVGAGPAGLAVAACLRMARRSFTVIEQAPHVGAAWRRHYDRLHLHTHRIFSALPGLPWPRSASAYPSREEVVAYLEAYANRFQIEPRLGEQVLRVRREGDRWRTETSAGVYESKHVVIATGYTRKPHLPSWPGMETFQGEIMHSWAYKNGARFKGQRVLVVGFGNSGGEIAIDLWEHGARPSIAVRGPVNITVRDFFGIPNLLFSLFLSKLPTGLADAIAAPLLYLRFGDIRKMGFQKSRYGPFGQMKYEKRIPLIDIGTIKLIRQGELQLQPGIERFTPEGVVFTDGREERFDAVVLATGYRPALGEFLQVDGLLDEEGAPTVFGTVHHVPGLHLVGFFVSPTGMLRSISQQARQVARAIAKAAESAR